LSGFVVIDPGPIAYSALTVAEEDDLEAALLRDELDPPGTTYRLIEVPIEAVDVFPWLSRWAAEGFASDAVDALSRGVVLPPVVGRLRGEKLAILDGVHRLVAHAALGHDRVRVYELLS
jgi:hypothetical protein